MPKKMRGKYKRLLAPFSVIFLVCSACGYSQDAWDQKVRRNGELREELAAAERARSQAENDYADALEELERMSQRSDEKIETNETSVHAESSTTPTTPAEQSNNDLPSLMLPRIQEALNEGNSQNWQRYAPRSGLMLKLPASQIFVDQQTALNDSGQQIINQLLAVLASEAVHFELRYALATSLASSADVAAVNAQATISSQRLKSLALLFSAKLNQQNNFRGSWSMKVMEKLPSASNERWFEILILPEPKVELKGENESSTPVASTDEAEL